jgi:hypothetical protein
MWDQIKFEFGFDVKVEGATMFITLNKFQMSE